MRARLEADVEGGVAKQGFIADRGYRVHFGVSFATFPMISFADNFPVVDHYRAHHGVRLCMPRAAARQFEAAPHKFFFY